MSFTDYYNFLKEDQNNISFWYPKIKDCGLLVPETFIITAPEDIVLSFSMEGNMQENIDKVYQWVKVEVLPVLPENLRGLVFMKNGTFSNKFDFGTCAIRANGLEIARNLIEINYVSMMFETGGNTEVAFRERISYDPEKTPCIYHGMPLRNEYRIFFNFDTKKALYGVNYWDWDYCHDDISRDFTDKIIYETVYPDIQKRFEANKDNVMMIVEEKMRNVEGLAGIWSVDILEDEEHSLWLIDMAVGCCSAYWNPELIGQNKNL